MTPSLCATAGYSEFADDESLSEYLAMLLEIQERLTEDKPVYQKNDAVVIKSAYNPADLCGVPPNIFVLKDAQVDCDRGANPPPYLAGLYAKRSTVQLPHWSQISVKLEEPLSTGFRHHAQVWKGELSYTGAAKPLAVVVKIYDEVMYAYEGSPPFNFYKSCGQAFARERWAYGRLQTLQGCIIPHSYGFYKVRTPVDRT